MELILKRYLSWVLDNRKWSRRRRASGFSRVLIVTDHEELDEQIEKNFSSVEENIIRTKSGKDLLGRLNVFDNWTII